MENRDNAESPEALFLATLYAAVAPEALRYLIRSAVQQYASVAALARAAGVPAPSLQRFLDGGGLSLKNWQALATFSRTLKPGLPPFAVVGLSLLIDSMPSKLRRALRGHVVSEIERFLRAHGFRPAAWLSQEVDYYC